MQERQMFSMHLSLRSSGRMFQYVQNICLKVLLTHDRAFGWEASFISFFLTTAAIIWHKSKDLFRPITTASEKKEQKKLKMHVKTRVFSV